MEKPDLPLLSLVALDVPVSLCLNAFNFHISGIYFLASAKFHLAQEKQQVPTK